MWAWQGSPRPPRDRSQEADTRCQEMTWCWPVLPGCAGGVQWRGAELCTRFPPAGSGPCLHFPAALAGPWAAGVRLTQLKPPLSGQGPGPDQACGGEGEGQGSGGRQQSPGEADP